MGKLYQSVMDNVAKEQETFLLELKSKSIDEVIGRAYEIAIRKELIVLLENREFSFSDLKKLCNIENPIQSLYWEWLSNSYDMNGALNDTIDDFLRVPEKQKKARLKSRHSKEECR